MKTHQEIDESIFNFLFARKKKTFSLLVRLFFLVDKFVFMSTTPRSTIDEFLEIAREQSSDIPNGASSDGHTLDVPMKKYPPLPDISQSDGRTTTYPIVRTEVTLTQSTKRASKMIHHFAPTQRGHLPALNKSTMLSNMTDVMDLDEDLPECHVNGGHRAATYTSPGDRIISPIKRPSAPSPPASAQVKRSGLAAGNEDQFDDPPSDSEDMESQFFDQAFFQHAQTMTMNNHRINHYNHQRPQYSHGRHPVMVIDGSYDDWSHPLDSYDLEK